MRSCGACYAGSPGTDALLGGRQARLPAQIYLAQASHESLLRRRVLSETELCGVVSPGLVCRCGRLRTLVLVLEDLSGEDRRLEALRDLVARLPALPWGAPALRALQLVLPMVVGPDPDVPGGMGEWAGGQLAQLRTALEALPNLASLTLGWITSSAYAEYSISIVLDAAQAGSPALLIVAILNFSL